MRLAALPGAALEVALHGGNEAGVRIRDHQIHAGEAAALEPGEEGAPARFRLAVAQLDAQDLAIPFGVDPDGDEGGECAHPLLLAHFHHERIGEDERECLLAQGALVPGGDQGVQPRTERRHRGLGETGPTQLLGDGRHFARGDAVDDHLHEREHQGLFTALVAGEELGRELALSHLGHAQREAAHPGGELTGTHTVTIALPLLSAFVALGPQLLAHLRLEHLVQDLLQQLRQSCIPLKQALYRLTIDGNLIVGHPVTSVVVAEQPDTPFSLRGEAGGFVSARGRLACHAALHPANFPAHIGHHSSALVALVNAADADHARALTLSAALRRARCNLLVPRDVLVETLNVVSKKIDRASALRAAEEISSSGPPFLVFESPDATLQDALQKWARQPASVSLTDCIVMACADHFETKEIFGFDEVFRKNGYHLPTVEHAEKAA